MKTIFDEKMRHELINRIHGLRSESASHWGKMNAYQMLKHCTLSEEMFLGRKTYARLFIGRLFGAMALNGILKNENPLKVNQPTHPDFKITGGGDFEKERTGWISLLQQYESFQNDNFVHPFFGKMSKEQIGQYVYKHTDHHLRQFNQ